jgi:hypothetical protein
MLRDGDTSSIANGIRIRCDTPKGGSDAIPHGYMTLAGEILKRAQDNVTNWLKSHSQLRETLDPEDYAERQLDAASSFAWLTGADTVRLTSRFIYESMGVSLYEVTETLDKKFSNCDPKEYQALKKIAATHFEWNQTRYA